MRADGSVFWLSEQYVRAAFGVEKSASGKTLLDTCQSNRDYFLNIPEGRRLKQSQSHTGTLAVGPKQTGMHALHFVQCDDARFCVPYGLANALLLAGFTEDAYTVSKLAPRVLKNVMTPTVSNE